MPAHLGVVAVFEPDVQIELPVVAWLDARE
jgi:hypothetical protein